VLVLLFVRRRRPATLEHVLGHGLGPGEVDLQRREGHGDLVVVRGGFGVEVSLDAVVCEGDQACSDDDAGVVC
jgi:hypothetical protein